MACLAPRDHTASVYEVLIKIHASTVNGLDCHTREANRRGGLAVTLLGLLVHLSDPQAARRDQEGGVGS